MKIHIEFHFWEWLAKLAMGKIIQNGPKNIPVGIPFHRDPDNKCEFYMPGKRFGNISAPECQSDGHYLCKGCVNLIKEESIDE